MTESGFTLFCKYLQGRKDTDELKLRKKAEKANKLKARIVSNYHTELRPVTAIPIPPAPPPPNLPPPPPAPAPRPLLPRPAAAARPERAEDYTGSICLLNTLTAMTPYYMEILIDIEDFERVAAYSWIIVYEGEHREPRVVRYGTPRYLHRFVTNAPKGMVVDHQFQNPLDNRRSKLRVCTTGQNNLNRRPRKKATSRFKGVSLCKRSGRWKVMCGARGHKVFLGSYLSEVDAAIVYNEFAMRTYGSMAYQNPID